ncbi:tyrosine-type recombinase/integrase [Mycolicibacterium neoaurum]|uniref:tyrosine-type recombinase/integrase n=1 Tax=Mycolicibacterium neoaurum TaxID=1795 RepID=UPI003AB94276
MARTSIKTRRGHVRAVARTLGAGTPAEVTTTDLVTLAAKQKWSNDHRRGLRTSLILFYDWAVAHGHARANPAHELPQVPESKPRPRPVPDWLWDEVVRKAGPRELLMARLACELGLRRAEVAQVHTDDVFWNGDGYALMVHGKGLRQRELPMLDDLAEEVQRGPGRWSGHDRGYLFPDKEDGHLSEGHVGVLLSRLLGPGWSGHKLRHRFASLGFAGTKDLLAVQKSLGHASPATTIRYTASATSEMRAVTEAVAARRPVAAIG